MDKKYKVYVHINKINNKMYVGVTCRTLNIRSGTKGQFYNDNPKFYKEIQEFGWDNFEHMILRDNLTREEAADIEREYIKLFATQDPEFGYNTLAGGFALYGEENRRFGKHHTEKTKAMLRESSKRLWTGESGEMMRSKLLGGNNSRARAVYCLSNDTMYPSIADASRALSVTCTRVKDVCKGIRNHTHGLKFMYADDERLKA